MARPEGESGGRGSVCSSRLEGARDSPTVTPDLALSSVQLSLSLFCSVVATFSLLHFPLYNLHIGVQRTRPLLCGRVGVFLM